MHPEHGRAGVSPTTTPGPCFPAALFPRTAAATQ
jgi:hypothetical protein